MKINDTTELIIKHSSNGFFRGLERTNFTLTGKVQYIKTEEKQDVTVRLEINIKRITMIAPHFFAKPVAVESTYNHWVNADMFVEVVTTVVDCSTETLAEARTRINKQ